jgi:hypothetical protein
MPFNSSRGLFDSGATRQFNTIKKFGENTPSL